MSRPEGCVEGEAPASQQRSGANRGSKVTLERVALLVASALLAAAVFVICRLSLAIVQTHEGFQTLREEHEAVIRNLTGRRCEEKTCNHVQTTCPPSPDGTLPGTCLKCEEGWEKHGGHCYYFSTSKSSWDESRAECQSKGGDLVQIDSREEQSFLHHRLQDKMDNAEDKFWIGLTDSQEEGNWLWVDGSALNESLSFWSAMEPDNWTGRNGEYEDGQDCARMGEKRSTHLNSWFDNFCTEAQKRICEKSAANGELKCV